MVALESRVPPLAAAAGTSPPPVSVSSLVRGVNSARLGVADTADSAGGVGEVAAMLLVLVVSSCPVDTTGGRRMSISLGVCLELNTDMLVERSAALLLDACASVWATLIGARTGPGAG